MLASVLADQGYDAQEFRQMDLGMMPVTNRAPAYDRHLTGSAILECHQPDEALSPDLLPV